jgi:hypothetical protein
MESVLFCIPLKKDCLSQYENFAKQTVKKEKEYKDMLNRYDIHCAKVWYKNINDRDYVFVYHEVGPNFRMKMKEWDKSEHPFDKWFRENMMAVYDIKNAAGMEEPRQIINFIA